MILWKETVMTERRRVRLAATALFVLSLIFTADIRAETEKLRPVREIGLRQPVPGSSGGLFAHDLDSDGELEMLVTSKGYIGAYELKGDPLWVKQADIAFFDTAHHPSAIAGDLDGDDVHEVAYGDPETRIHFLNGTTGEEERTLDTPGEPRAMMIANLRGKGDRDIILQYSQTEIAAIRAGDGSVLWRTGKYRCIEHSSARVADLDGDGLDEVAGATIIDHDGKKMNSWDLGHAYRWMDSMVIADVVEGGPLEVVLAEQLGAKSRTDVVNPERVVFRALNPWNWEDPDKVAVGDFDPESAGLEIFNRSSGGDGTGPRGNEEPYANEQCPWILNSRGDLMTKYYVNDYKPSWWTGHGLEEIFRIDWDGDERHEILAKERHKIGAAAIINPMNGRFKTVFRVKAARVYAADIMDDFREEAVVLDQDGTLKVFACREPAPTEKPSYWNQQHYRRQKQNWNYYSP